MLTPRLFLTVSLFIATGSAITGCTIPDTTPVETLHVVEEGAYAADISSDGSVSVVSGANNGIVVWETGASAPTFQWSHQGGDNNTVGLVHISADKQYAVTSDRNAFALWNMRNGEPEGFWRIDESTVRDIAVANNGRGILVGRSSGKVMFFEPRTQRRLEFMGHQEKINSVDISPNGKFALSGGNDYTAYLWSTESGQIIHTFHHPTRVTHVALDDQGRYAFTADSQKKSKIWNVQTGEPISNLQYIARQKIFTDAVFSEDGKYLLTGSPNRRIELWDVQTGEQLESWEVQTRQSQNMPSAVVYGVGFIDNARILSLSSSGLAEIWEINHDQ